MRDKRDEFLTSAPAQQKQKLAIPQSFKPVIMKWRGFRVSGGDSNPVRLPSFSVVQTELVI